MIAISYVERLSGGKYRIICDNKEKYLLRPSGTIKAENNIIVAAEDEEILHQAILPEFRTWCEACERRQKLSGLPWCRICARRDSKAVEAS